jgi:hypothetical protein
VNDSFEAASAVFPMMHKIIGAPGEREAASDVSPLNSLPTHL